VLGAGGRYLFQRVPLYRRDRQADQTAAPDLDRELVGDRATLQRARDGLGPLYHRRYWIAVTDERRTPEELIAFIAADPNRVAPTAMARFETLDGQAARDLEVGDELVVRLPGPWNGPVRVVERTPTSFRLATMVGHMEAGEIEFRAGYEQRGFLEFEINSWARSGDRLFQWLYERFPVGREMQLHMWAQFCQQVAQAAGGVRMSNVACATRTLEDHDG
jgi:hypothetical protein